MGIMQTVVLPIRVAQVIVAIIVLGISAHLVAEAKDGNFFGYGSSVKDRSAYNVFVSVWTIVLEIFLIASSFFFKDAGSIITVGILAIDALSWIFWVAAFACVAAIGGYMSSSQLAALIAFGVIEWVLFTVTLVLGILAFAKGGRKAGDSGV